MNSDRANSLLGMAADRAREWPAFLGWVFAAYERLQGLSGEQLRDRLGIGTERWLQLQLCLRPRAAEFLPDVTQIATEFGVDRSFLAAIVRLVEAVEVCQTREELSETGSMLAARTRQPPPSEPEATTDETVES